MLNRLECRKEAKENKVTLFLKGHITNDTAPSLSDALLSLDYQDLDLTLDFSEVEYITSAGLRTLLVARKKLTDDTMRIVNCNAAVSDVFTMTGFDAFIKIKVREQPDEKALKYSLAALLQKRVEKDKDAVAYIYMGKNYTWGDVEIASQIIADDLAAIGVKKGSHVGLCGVNSPNWVFTLFATQKLGAIAVLLNPACKPQEISKLSRIADITHLCYAEIPKKTSFDVYADAFVSENNARKAYNISQNIDLSENGERYASIANLYREPHYADDASVVIFTSGSTGDPKAVLISSYGILTGVAPISKTYKTSKTDVNLGFLPLFHIFGFATSIAIPLLCGYQTVIPCGKNPAEMIELIEKYRCTIFNTVPTMMLAMLQTPTFAPEKMDSLRVSILGGSATTEAQMGMLKRIMPTVHFGNIYGMSENAAVSITLYEDSVAHITQTVGKPVEGLELIVKDGNGNRMPNGEQGEIYIRSQSMVVCYYKLSIEKQPIDDEGYLATGDLGYLDEQGYLHLTGRVKDLIICGGENISPGEIADVLSSLDEIQDVKIIGMPDEIMGEVVTAALVMKPGYEFDEAKVREYVANCLAKYKWPVHYLIFDSFPLLGSGKIDAVTLKKLAEERLKTNSEIDLKKSFF